MERAAWSGAYVPGYVTIDILCGDGGAKTRAIDERCGHVAMRTNHATPAKQRMLATSGSAPDDALFPGSCERLLDNVPHASRERLAERT
jgi:hypothetical protein